MTKWIVAAALVAAGLASGNAHAQGPSTGAPAGSYVVSGGVGGAYGYAPGGGHGHGHFTGTGKFWSRSWFGKGKFSSSQNLTMMPTLPVFMAAPWYQYWPYDGHFQTVAPMAHAGFYPPPAYTGNPFMPGAYPGYVAGAPHPTYPMGPVK